MFTMSNFHIRIPFLILTWAAFTVKVISSTANHTPADEWISWSSWVNASVWEWHGAVVCVISVAERCLKRFSHANSSAVVHWHPHPSLVSFFVRSFVNVGAKMFTRSAVQTGFFSPVTPFPPHPSSGDRAITQHYVRSHRHQHLIASCVI